MAITVIKIGIMFIKKKKVYARYNNNNVLVRRILKDKSALCTVGD